MSSAKSDQDSPCCFLELPTEIRLMIYEEYKRLSAPHKKYLFVDQLAGTKNRRFVELSAVTRVNSQIRQESLPIIYRDIILNIWTVLERDKKRARLWAEKIATSAVLASIVKFEFDSLRGCNASIKINLTCLEGPMTRMKHEGCCVNFAGHCNILDAFCHKVEAKLQGLKGAHDERCVMTLETMQSLVEWFCNLSDDYNNPAVQREDESLDETSIT